MASEQPLPRGERRRERVSQVDEVAFRERVGVLRNGDSKGKGFEEALLDLLWRRFLVHLLSFGG